jgi:hypothetical protein
MKTAGEFEMFTKYLVFLKQTRVVSSVLLIGGVFLFLCVVIPLHFVQANYNPRYQLMSELALGAQGGWMLLAFIGLSCAALGTQTVLWQQQTSGFLRLIFGSVALCFLGSGIFTLGESDVMHITLVALAFVGSVLGMLLFSTQAGKAAALMPQRLSLLLAIGITLSVFLGHGVLDIGIAQRLAASCLLLWFVILGWKNLKESPQ